MKKYLNRAIEIIDNNQCEECAKEFTTCLRRMTKQEKARLSEYTLKRCDSKFYNKIKNDTNFKAKVIAAYVRQNIEGFHSSYLNNEQMKELNPLIRNAIYTALIDFNENILKCWGVAKFDLPEYWEDCKYW